MFSKYWKEKKGDKENAENFDGETDDEIRTLCYIFTCPSWSFFVIAYSIAKGECLFVSESQIKT